MQQAWQGACCTHLQLRCSCKQCVCTALIATTVRASLAVPAALVLVCFGRVHAALMQLRWPCKQCVCMALTASTVRVTPAAPAALGILGLGCLAGRMLHLCPALPSHRVKLWRHSQCESLAAPAASNPANSHSSLCGTGCRSHLQGNAGVWKRERRSTGYCEPPSWSCFAACLASCYETGAACSASDGAVAASVTSIPHAAVRQQLWMLVG